MASPALDIVTAQNAGCIRCGRCCRRWHVALLPGEAERLRAACGQPGSGDLGEIEDPVCHIGGHPYIAHRASGDCVFLDAATRLCRLQQRHGFAAKPLGCRVYPLNLASSLPGRVSASVRFDCPAVCRNQGQPLSTQREEIAGCMGQLGLCGRMSDDALAGLEPETVRRLASWLEELATHGPEPSPGRGSLAMLLAVGELRRLGADFLNDRETLGEILPPLARRFRERAAALAAQDRHDLTALERGLFRLWLAGFLRRDEELVGQGAVARARRAWNLGLLFVGRGTLRALGREHPDVAAGAGLRRPVGTGGEAAPWGEHAAWECWRRFLHVRLESLQFFGVSFYDRPVWDGAAALARTGALVAAAARLAAVAAGRGAPAAADVEYAVGAIDHAFGRSALLAGWGAGVLEARFAEPAAYVRLLRSLDAL